MMKCSPWVEIVEIAETVAIVEDAAGGRAAEVVGAGGTVEAEAAMEEVGVDTADPGTD